MGFVSIINEKKLIWKAIYNYYKKGIEILINFYLY